MVQALNLKFQVVHHAAATHLSRRIFWNPMFIAIIHFISLFGCQPFASEKILDASYSNHKTETDL